MANKKVVYHPLPAPKFIKWQTAASFITASIVFYYVWRIETYFGRCGTAVMGWLTNATVVGTIGSAIAVRSLVRTWHNPGIGAAVSRVIHMTLLCGFTLFLIKNFVYRYLH